MEMGEWRWEKWAALLCCIVLLPSPFSHQFPSSLAFQLNKLKVLNFQLSTFNFQLNCGTFVRTYS